MTLKPKYLAFYLPVNYVSSWQHSALQNHQKQMKHKFLTYMDNSFINELPLLLQTNCKCSWNYSHSSTHTYTHTAVPVAQTHFDNKSVRVNYTRYKAKKIHEHQALHSEYSMTKPSRKQWTLIDKVWHFSVLLHACSSVFFNSAMKLSLALNQKYENPNVICFHPQMTIHLTIKGPFQTCSESNWQYQLVRDYIEHHHVKRLKLKIHKSEKTWQYTMEFIPLLKD